MSASALHRLSNDAPVAQPPVRFMEDRVDAYYRDRAINPETGSHPLKGRVPAVGDILVTSSDYLSLARHPEIVEAQLQVLREMGHGEPRSGGGCLWRRPAARAGKANRRGHAV